MERTLGGLLAALVLTLCLASTAQAGTIPPTTGCAKAFKKVFPSYLVKTAGGHVSKKTRTAENRKLGEKMESRGCISDAVPMYTDVSAKPFTDQCVEASAKAQAFFGPRNARYGRLTEQFRKEFEMPYIRKESHIYQRQVKLKREGKSEQYAALSRRLKAMDIEYDNRLQKFNTRLNQPELDGYRITLAFSELRSLRCLGYSFVIDRDSKNPAIRVVARNLGLILSTYDYISSNALTEPGKPQVAPVGYRLDGTQTALNVSGALSPLVENASK